MKQFLDKLKEIFVDFVSQTKEKRHSSISQREDKLLG